MQELNQNDKNEGVLSKSIKGGKWLTIGYTIQKLLSLASFIVLARFLRPADFGVMAIILAIPKFLESATDTGFGSSIIQKEGEITRYLNPIWTIGVIKSIIIMALVFISGPYIANFFQTEVAVLAIQLGGVFIVIQNLFNIGETFLFKEMDFKKIIIRNVLRDIVYILVGISIALFWKSYWALFFATIASYATQTISTYFLHPYRPRLSLSFGKLKDLFNYSKWIIGQTWITQLYGLMETSILARLTNITSLGLYTKAKNMAAIAPGFIGPTIQTISFPAYSKIQKDTEKINEGLIKSMQIVSFLLIPATSLILLAGGKIILIILGQDWLGMTNILRVMLIFFFIAVINDILYSLFNAIGYPDKQVKVNLIKIIITLPLLIYFTSKFGAIGASFALLVGIVPITALNLLNVARLTKARVRDILGTIIIPLVASIILVIPALIYKDYVLQLPAIILWPKISGLPL